MNEIIMSDYEWNYEWKWMIINDYERLWTIMNDYEWNYEWKWSIINDYERLWMKLWMKMPNERSWTFTKNPYERPK